jgi:phosphatidylserine decarboxylase
MSDIIYFDRITKSQEREKVYGHSFLNLLYGRSKLAKCLSLFLRPLFARISFLSYLYGWIQKSRLSRCKVKPFIETFGVDPSEFLEPVEKFSSFNDFFIRRLNLKTRPIAAARDVAVMPADARYLVFPNIEQADGFWVKGKKFSLASLLQSEELAQRYNRGAMVIARLCPTDYHRFHFPCACVPDKAQLINGPLYSVNPIALKRNIAYLSENKRMITLLKTEDFGDVLYVEIGATYVGSIHQTYAPGTVCNKGDEKGYFSFGGSCLILLFEPGKILLDQDLVDCSSQKMEVRGLLGQSLGRLGTG